MVLGTEGYRNWQSGHLGHGANKVTGWGDVVNR